MVLFRPAPSQPSLNALNDTVQQLPLVQPGYAAGSVVEERFLPPSESSTVGFSEPLPGAPGEVTRARDRETCGLDLSAFFNFDDAPSEAAPTPTRQSSDEVAFCFHAFREQSRRLSHNLFQLQSLVATRTDEHVLAMGGRQLVGHEHDIALEAELQDLKRDAFRDEAVERDMHGKIKERDALVSEIESLEADFQWEDSRRKDQVAKKQRLQEEMQQLCQVGAVSENVLGRLKCLIAEKQGEEMDAARQTEAARDLLQTQRAAQRAEAARLRQQAKEYESRLYRPGSKSDAMSEEEVHLQHKIRSLRIHVENLTSELRRRTGETLPAHWAPC